MHVAKICRLIAVTSAVMLGLALLTMPAQAAPVPNSVPGRYIVVARNAADFAALRDSALRAGAKIVLELPEAGAFLMASSVAVHDALQADARTLGVAADHVRSIDDSERSAPNLDAPGLRSAHQV